MKKVQGEMSSTVLKEKSIWKEILDWITCFVVAFVVAVIIRYFIGTPTLVSQTSMTPTSMRSLSTVSYPDVFQTSGTGGRHRSSVSRIMGTKGVPVMKEIV